MLSYTLAKKDKTTRYAILYPLDNFHQLERFTSVLVARPYGGCGTSVDTSIFLVDEACNTMSLIGMKAGKERTEDFSTNVLPSGFFVVHDTGRGSEDDVAE